jgi:uncharacterized protein (DUF2141 family)
MMSLAASDTASVELTITGLRSAKGLVHLCMTANPALLNKCDKDPAARKLSIAAAKATKIELTGLAPGTYAVALLHDENGNSKMDTLLGMPREGFAFSRNPVIRMGPPKFADASFKAEAGVTTQQVIKFKYML